MQRLYAIGDIHGQLDMLRRAHARIARDRTTCGDDDAPVVHLGDLVDRGPDSAGVIGYLLAAAARRRDIIVLQGNHDRMFRLFLAQRPLADPCMHPDYTWLHERIGGLAALASYGIDTGDADFDRLHAAARTVVPADHIAFLESLGNCFMCPGLFLVHAGVRPGIALDRQTEDDMLWIRKPFHDDTRDHGALVIHGHTPVDAVTHYGNRVNIDSGAGYGRELSVVVIEGSSLHVLTEDGRRPLSGPPRRFRFGRRRN